MKIVTAVVLVQSVDLGSVLSNFRSFQLVRPAFIAMCICITQHLATLSSHAYAAVKALLHQCLCIQVV